MNDDKVRKKMIAVKCNLSTLNATLIPLCSVLGVNLNIVYM